MDVETFQRLEAPAGKRSSLEPYRNEIFLLSEKGYSHLQIQRWLATNGIAITRSAVTRFLQTAGRTVIGPSSMGRPSPRPTTSQAADAPFQIRRFTHDPVPDLDKLIGKKK